jgi:hypothetical protein
MSAHGDPAFPCQMLGSTGLPVTELAPGITIRDYFAARAMSALISTVSDSRSVGMVGADAYYYADQMLAAREKAPEA